MSKRISPDARFFNTLSSFFTAFDTVNLALSGHHCEPMENNADNTSRGPGELTDQDIKLADNFGHRWRKLEAFNESGFEGITLRAWSLCWKRYSRGPDVRLVFLVEDVYQEKKLSWNSLAR